MGVLFHFPYCILLVGLLGPEQETKTKVEKREKKIRGVLGSDISQMIKQYGNSNADSYGRSKFAFKNGYLEKLNRGGQTGPLSKPRPAISLIFSLEMVPPRSKARRLWSTPSDDTWHTQHNVSVHCAKRSAPTVSL